MRINLSVQPGKSIRNLPETLKAGTGRWPDLVIGGSGNAQVKQLVKISAEEKITVISPFTPVSNAALANPYYVQAMPDFEAFCEAITVDVMDNFPNANVHLLGPSSSERRFEIFRELKRKYDEAEGRNVSREFNEIVLDKGSIQELDYSVIGSGYQHVFIIPMDRDKLYLQALLDHLAAMEENQRFIVYGIPPWDKYDMLFQYFIPLEIRLATHMSMRKDKRKFKDFERRYYDKYHGIPDAIAAYGYDLTHSVLSTLDRTGVPIYPGLAENRIFYGFSSTISYRPVLSKKSTRGPESEIQYFRNTGIVIEK